MSSPLSFREHYWTSSDGLQLCGRIYETERAGALAVMCLPGLTRNSRDFEAFAPHLAGRFRVICPDLRGRGQSQYDPDWRNYQLAVYLKDLQGLLDELDLGRVAIVGTSLGGLLAMLLAASVPERVAGIVLNDIGPEVDAAGLERIRGYTGHLPPVHTWNEALEQLRQVYGQAWPDLSVQTWARLVHRSYSADAAGRPRLDFDPAIAEALRRARPNEDDLWPIFKRLRALRMLVVRGGLSDILSTTTLERMCREKPNLEHVTVANRGHVPLLDEPVALTAIDRFLDMLQQSEYGH